jgi:hypothetical protein
MPFNVEDAHNWQTERKWLWFIYFLGGKKQFPSGQVVTQQRFEGVPSKYRQQYSYSNLLGTIMDYERSINLNNEIPVHLHMLSSYTV